MKHWFHLSVCSVLHLGFVLALGVAMPCRAQEQPFRLALMTDPVTQDDDQYNYRKINHDRTISLMLYGFQDQSSNTPTILKNRKALGGFFKQHFDRIKRDYLGQDGHSTMKVMAGDPAFTSTPIDRGIDTEPAKMVGLTMPSGHLTFGGGYLWGEKNPAIMMPKADGLFVGASYDTGSTGFQISYVTSGQKVMGFDVGGTDKRYNNIMVGTSFRMTKRLSLTATLQYRTDDDPLTRGDNAAVATIGTKWKF